MVKKPKIPKARHPADINGDFASPGGREIYQLLWSLQARVSRGEALWVINAILLAAVLAKMFGVIPEG